MSVGENESEYLTQIEVTAAIDSMTDAEYRRLERQSAFMALSVPGVTDNDLLHEALVRLRAGERQWKRGLDLLTTVYKIMVSIARDTRKRAKEGPIDRFASVSEDATRNEDDEESPQLSAVAVAAASPEHLAGSRELLALLEQLAQGKVDEEAVVLGWALGHSAKEAALEAGIEMKDYEAARKRMERKLANFKKQVG